MKKSTKILNTLYYKNINRKFYDQYQACFDALEINSASFTEEEKELIRNNLNSCKLAFLSLYNNVQNDYNKLVVKKEYFEYEESLINEAKFEKFAITIISIMVMLIATPEISKRFGIMFSYINALAIGTIDSFVLKRTNDNLYNNESVKEYLKIQEEIYEDIDLNINKMDSIICELMVYSNQISSNKNKIKKHE